MNNTNQRPVFVLLIVSPYPREKLALLIGEAFTQLVKGDHRAYLLSDGQIERQIADVAQAIAFQHSQQDIQLILIVALPYGRFEFGQREVIDTIQIAGS